MTLAIEHKSEENSISPCFTNTLLAARTYVKFVMLGKFSKKLKACLERQVLSEEEGATFLYCW